MCYEKVDTYFREIMSTLLFIFGKLEQIKFVSKKLIPLSIVLIK